jgi:hypothetical protein
MLFSSFRRISEIRKRLPYRDTKSWKCENVIDTLARVYSLAFFERKIFSASGLTLLLEPTPSPDSRRPLTSKKIPADGSIGVWNIDTWECDHVLEGHGHKEEDEGASFVHEVSKCPSASVPTRGRQLRHLTMTNADSSVLPLSGRCSKTARQWQL